MVGYEPYGALARAASHPRHPHSHNQNLAFNLRKIRRHMFPDDAVVPAAPLQKEVV